MPNISAALAQLDAADFAVAAHHFFDALGYQSDKTETLPAPTAAGFAATFGHTFTKGALQDEWQSVHLLFQLTGDEMSGQLAFAGDDFNRNRFDSFLFFAVDLKCQTYSRTQLAGIARELNKPFPMPVIVLLRHGGAVTLASVARRPRKDDDNRDVLERVSLLKDIELQTPHRAHLDILGDLAGAKSGARNWAEFFAAWNRVLDISELNKKFYRELSDWYFWACQNVEFPRPQSDKRSLEEHRAMSVIRLITRLIFVWFIKERDLVPDELFQLEEVEKLLGPLQPAESLYYKAILQNLFFATLNTDGNRQWRQRKDAGFGDPNYNTHTLWRYQAAFKNPDAAAQLFNRVPFLNGGLFRCLDQDVATSSGKSIVERYDGFSERPDNPLRVPNFLFWGDEQMADLNEAYGTTNREYGVRPLFSILRSYKFTVAENTPLEEEVALDPELLGKVFENLLASYNPETSSTARKQTGSFYTPRPIVDYLVEASLFSHLQTRAPNVAAETIRALLSPDASASPALSDAEKDELIGAIHGARVLDPACGSGAFIMGALDALVRLLRKIDPHNARWKAQENRAIEAINFPEARDAARARFEKAFDHDEGDYARKLYLLERCIHGVDIQPIAVQIAKLRVFIALAVEQTVDRDNPDNMGIESLPNLETKIVAANTLRALEKPVQLDMFTAEIQEKLRGKVLEYFTCFRRARKLKLEAEIESLFGELGDYLEQTDKNNATDAAKLRSWRFTDQNASAPFFDPEWMFGAHVKDGFDIIIGNPPYVHIADIGLQKEELSVLKKYEVAEYRVDLFHLFIERGVNLLNDVGNLGYILPNPWLTQKFTSKLRKFLLTKSHLRQLIVLDGLIFESATVNTALLLTSKEKTQNPILIKRLGETASIESLRSALAIEVSHSQWLNTEDFAFEVRVGDKKSDLARKIMASHEKLGDVCRASLGCQAYNSSKHTPEQIESRAFHADTQLDATYMRELAGKDVSRYLISPKRGQWIKYGSWLHDYRPMDWLVGPRILIREITGKAPHQIQASYVEEPFCNYKTILNVNPKAEHPETDKKPFMLFITGVLNSRLISFVHPFASNKIVSQSFPRLSVRDLRKFPIPTATAAEQAAIAARVESILAAKAGDVAADVAALEREIDELVYALYALTPDEIALVEGA